MILRSCYGCKLQGQPCDARDAFKASLRGLGVTSVKWMCKARAPKFDVGDPVWALTFAGYGSDYYDDGELCRDYFPGTVVRVIGGKALVYIRPGAQSEYGEYEFDANGNGFCKIPFIRLKPRDGNRETVCRHCELPASFGHAEGYSCAFAAERNAGSEAA